MNFINYVQRYEFKLQSNEQSNESNEHVEMFCTVSFKSANTAYQYMYFPSKINLHLFITTKAHYRESRNKFWMNKSWQ